MKNKFKYYVGAWAVLFAVYNAVVFLVRPAISDFEISYDVRFWVAWIAVIAAFVGNLFCAKFAFRAKDSEELLYRVPLITLSRKCLIFMFIVSGALMLVPNCPAWISAVLCIAILGFNAISVIKASAAAELTVETGEKVKNKVSLMRALTADAENLVSVAKTDEAKADCKRVYEALRYSDPISNDALSDIEYDIKRTLEGFANQVKSRENCSELADELVNMIGERNKKCKAVK